MEFICPNHSRSMRQPVRDLLDLHQHGQAVLHPGVPDAPVDTSDGKSWESESCSDDWQMMTCHTASPPPIRLEAMAFVGWRPSLFGSFWGDLPTNGCRETYRWETYQPFGRPPNLFQPSRGSYRGLPILIAIWVTLPCRLGSTEPQCHCP